MSSQNDSQLNSEAWIARLRRWVEILKEATGLLLRKPVGVRSAKGLEVGFKEKQP